jgi:hypothetical protein
VFEDRSIDQISEAEWHELITTGTREQQRLEFKATLRLSVDKALSDKEKLEMLLDVSSLANAVGGYLVYGVKDDGNDRTGGYSGLTRDEAKRIETTIDELCVTYITERIEGLEVRFREIEQHFLVIVKVPASSKAPHMVTFSNVTSFYIRHDDHKRRMTIGEIRSAFNDDLFGRRLTRVEQGLSQILDFMKSSGPVNLQESFDDSSSAVDGNSLSRDRRKAVWERYG